MMWYELGSSLRDNSNNDAVLRDPLIFKRKKSSIRKRDFNV